MIKAVRIESPYGNDERDIVVKLNEFFEKEKLGKADIVNISMVNKTAVDYRQSDYIAFYVFYDTGQD
jgi:hypothetical protein